MDNYSLRFQNLTKEYLYDNLKQNPVSGKWGVELDIIGKLITFLSEYVLLILEI